MHLACRLEMLQDRRYVHRLIRAELAGKNQIWPEEKRGVSVNPDLAVRDAAENRKHCLHRVRREQEVYGLILRCVLACHREPEAVTARCAELAVMDNKMHALQLRLRIPALCGGEQHLCADLRKSGAVQQHGRGRRLRNRILRHIQQRELKKGFCVSHFDTAVIRCDESHLVCKGLQYPLEYRCKQHRFAALFYTARLSYLQGAGPAARGEHDRVHLRIRLHQDTGPLAGFKVPSDRLAAAPHNGHQLRPVCQKPHFHLLLLFSSCQLPE